jgi:hypothetical protein
MSIAYLMKNNSNLRVLQLRCTFYLFLYFLWLIFASDNKITAVGGAYIADALKENKTLAKLDLACT